MKEKSQDSFQRTKASIINKMEKNDKSSKGSIDEEILPVCNAINSIKGFVTTSSCSGRISIVKGDEGEKTKNAWVFKSHCPVTCEELLKADLPQGLTLLKMEGAILHIACESISYAESLITAAKESGIKRAGIISIRKNKVMVETIFGESLCLPFSADGKLLISLDYLRFSLEIANKKLKRSREKLKSLEINIKRKVNGFF
jgi:tRNA wybutosine-synthesizing protein 3